MQMHLNSLCYFIWERYSNLYENKLYKNILTYLSSLFSYQSNYGPLEIKIITIIAWQKGSVK